ncbi:MAG: permease [Pseudomonadota bacterium]
MSITTLNTDARRFVPSGRTLKMAAGALLTIVIALADPREFAEALRFAAISLLVISPVVLFGLVLTAAITASGSMALIAAAFRGNEMPMVVLASFIGALTPVCGVTVLPLVAGLLAGGVPFAPIMAFWLSSPVTDPGMLAVTAGMLGLPFAIGKTAAAFGAGIFGGAVCWLLARAGRLGAPARLDMARKLSGSRCGSCVSEILHWKFWEEAERRAVFSSVCRANGMLMIGWLLFAFTAEHYLRKLLPAEVLSTYVGVDSDFAVPLAAVVGAPIYLDGYAALPLLRGLLENGMAPGPAMTFLIAGGIISAWAVLPVLALVRLPAFSLYVLLAISSSMLAGWTFAFMV